MTFAPPPHHPQPLAQPQSWRAQARSHLGTGLRCAVGYVLVIWAVFLVNVIVFGGALNAFGVHPLDLSGLTGVLAAPVLHANLAHIVANTVPGAVFAFLIGLSGPRAFWEVTAITVVVAGLGTWVFGGVGSNHIGASGLVYGWLAYLLVRGVFNRSLGQLGLGVILGMAYSGWIWGVLPLQAGVSWESHLFGAIGGVLAGMIITSDDVSRKPARSQAPARRQAHTQ
ncbi:rhomboid family intramembrane serine protease [Corynebacterium uberis]|uniref:rhomboid family intramembrane serine protease n=1 Tax=Corynebacterium TaxID=1716 RepID=UPI001D0A5ECC|nr:MULTISPECIES: rhomboid family intramembrane serine protease [Corynebacterium]MCZ9310217.1 rhomboid family intramembrane serine protease [Corynebacterium sp. c6VSa_13]UDL73694.1 rhomboid family intramembrane serine protease [Corynebacterium uberis]UDL75424.1 rhomboid family intramembrane serine protease [Corynebacterium uberis]UDL77637.1 rhomboid family intramembrane serine protease [Corynebacterium uberis]UDL79922.1 rhomboid family intramembrane serine protease [Corynebacterium uberis]